MQDFLKTILPVYFIMLSSLVALGYFTVLLSREFWRQGGDNPKIGRWLPLVLIVLGLVLRLVWIDWTQPVPDSDFRIHWEIAQQFYNGDILYTEIERHPGIMVLVAMAMRIFSPSLWSDWIMNILFSVVLMLTMYQLALNLFNRASAMVLLAVVAVWPQFIAYCALVATEVPSAAYMMLLVWAVAYQREKSPGLWYYAALGALVTGGMLIRSTTVLLAGLAALVVLYQGRSDWKTAIKKVAVTMVTALVLFSGWCVHQYVVSGSPKPFWGMGIWLACAANAPTEGRNVDLATLPQYRDIFEAEKQMRFAGEAQQKVWRFNRVQGRAIEIIKADLPGYLKLGVVRMKRIIWTNQSAISWTTKKSDTAARHFSKGFLNFLRQFSTHSWRIILCLSPLALLGFVVRTGKQRDVLSLIVLFAAVWMVFHYLLSVAAERYGFQVVPFILLMTTGTLYYGIIYARHSFSRSM